MNKQKGSILKLFLLLAAGLAAASAWFKLSYYDVSLSTAYFMFVVGLVSLTIFYIAMYSWLPFTRRAWGAFLAGALWLLVYFATARTLISWDLISLFGITIGGITFAILLLVVTSLVDCVIVAGTSWVIQKWKTCAPATLSLVLGIFALLILLLFESTGTTARHTHIEMLPYPIAGFVLGVVAPFCIGSGKDMRAGRVLVALGLILNGIIIFGLVANWWSEYTIASLIRRLIWFYFLKLKEAGTNLVGRRY